MRVIGPFNGYTKCNWCLHLGKYLGGSDKYIFQVVDPETMQSAFQTGALVRGFKNVSPLINLYSSA